MLRTVCHLRMKGRTSFSWKWRGLIPESGPWLKGPSRITANHWHLDNPLQPGVRILRRAHQCLPPQGGARAGIVRREAGETRMGVLDSRTVKAPAASERGFDGGKRMVGRKRHVAVDTADVSGSVGAQVSLAAMRKWWPWLKHLSAGGGYDSTQLMNKAAFLDFVAESSARSRTRRISRSCRDDWSSSGHLPG